MKYERNRFELMVKIQLIEKQSVLIEMSFMKTYHFVLFFVCLLSFSPNLLSQFNNPWGSNNIKYYKVAIHFIKNETKITKKVRSCLAPFDTINYVGYGNFSEYDDGFKDPFNNGINRAKQIIDEANLDLIKNEREIIPSAIDASVHIAAHNKVRYVLESVYFHSNSTFYKNQDADLLPEIHNQYDVSGKDVIDVYYAPSLFTNEKEISSLIGSQDNFVFISDYFNYIRCKDYSLGLSAKLFNFKMSHLVNNFPFLEGGN
jgi:hypothetical protein